MFGQRFVIQFENFQPRLQANLDDRGGDRMDNVSRACKEFYKWMMWEMYLGLVNSISKMNSLDYMSRSNSVIKWTMCVM